MLAKRNMFGYDKNSLLNPKLYLRGRQLQIQVLIENLILKRNKKIE